MITDRIGLHSVLLPLLIKIYSKIKVLEEKNIKLQSHLITSILHVILAIRMTDVIQLLNNTPCFFFQPMKLEHLAVGAKSRLFFSCSRVQARNFPTLFVTSEQVGHVFLVSAIYIAFLL